MEKSTNPSSIKIQMNNFTLNLQTLLSQDNQQLPTTQRKHNKTQRRTKSNLQDISPLKVKKTNKEKQYLTTKYKYKKQNPLQITKELNKQSKLTQFNKISQNNQYKLSNNRSKSKNDKYSKFQRHFTQYDHVVQSARLRTSPSQHIKYNNFNSQSISKSASRSRSKSYKKVQNDKSKNRKSLSKPMSSINTQRLNTHRSISKIKDKKLQKSQKSPQKTKKRKSSKSCQRQRKSIDNYSKIKKSKSRQRVYTQMTQRHPLDDKHLNSQYILLNQQKIYRSQKKQKHENVKQNENLMSNSSQMGFLGPKLTLNKINSKQKIKDKSSTKNKVKKKSGTTNSTINIYKRKIKEKVQGKEKIKKLNSSKKQSTKLSKKQSLRQKSNLQSQNNFYQSTYIQKKKLTQKDLDQIFEKSGSKKSKKIKTQSKQYDQNEYSYKQSSDIKKKIIRSKHQSQEIIKQKAFKKKNNIDIVDRLFEQTSDNKIRHYQESRLHNKKLFKQQISNDRNDRKQQQNNKIVSGFKNKIIQIGSNKIIQMGSNKIKQFPNLKKLTIQTDFGQIQNKQIYFDDISKILLKRKDSNDENQNSRNSICRSQKSIKQQIMQNKHHQSIQNQLRQSSNTQRQFESSENRQKQYKETDEFSYLLYGNKMPIYNRSIGRDQFECNNEQKQKGSQIRQIKVQDIDQSESEYQNEQQQQDEQQQQQDQQQQCNKDNNVEQQQQSEQIQEKNEYNKQEQRNEKSDNELEQLQQLNNHLQKLINIKQIQKQKLQLSSKSLLSSQLQNHNQSNQLISSDQSHISIKAQTNQFINNNTNIYSNNNNIYNNNNISSNNNNISNKNNIKNISKQHPKSFTLIQNNNINKLYNKNNQSSQSKHISYHQNKQSISSTLINYNSQLIKQPIYSPSSYGLQNKQKIIFSLNKPRKSIEQQFNIAKTLSNKKLIQQLQLLSTLQKIQKSLQNSLIYQSNHHTHILDLNDKIINDIKDDKINSNHQQQQNYFSQQCWETNTNIQKQHLQLNQNNSPQINKLEHQLLIAYQNINTKQIKSYLNNNFIQQNQSPKHQLNCQIIQQKQDSPLLSSNEKQFIRSPIKKITKIPLQQIKIIPFQSNIQDIDHFFNSQQSHQFKQQQISKQIPFFAFNSQQNSLNLLSYQTNQQQKKQDHNQFLNHNVQTNNDKFQFYSQPQQKSSLNTKKNQYSQLTLQFQKEMEDYLKDTTSTTRKSKVHKIRQNNSQNNNTNQNLLNKQLKDQSLQKSDDFFYYNNTPSTKIQSDKQKIQLSQINHSQLIKDQLCQNVIDRMIGQFCQYMYKNKQILHKFLYFVSHCNMVTLQPNEQNQQFINQNNPNQKRQVNEEQFMEYLQSKIYAENQYIVNLANDVIGFVKRSSQNQEVFLRNVNKSFGIQPLKTLKWMRKVYADEQNKKEDKDQQNQQVQDQQQENSEDQQKNNSSLSGLSDCQSVQAIFPPTLLADFDAYQSQIVFEQMNQQQFYLNHALYAALNQICDKYRPYGQNGYPVIPKYKPRLTKSIQEVQPKIMGRLQNILSLRWGRTQFGPDQQPERVITEMYRRMDENIRLEKDQRWSQRNMEDTIFENVYYLATHVIEAIINQQIMQIFRMFYD